MRPTSFLRSVSSRLLARRSISLAVVPLPEQSRFSEEITAKLDKLRVSEFEFTSADWLVDVLDATISTQKVAQDYLVNNVRDSAMSELDKEIIDNYLEDNVELLDACNGLVEKIDLVHKYVDSLQTTIRSIGIETRSQELFKECGKIEAQCIQLDKCSPKLCKLLGRKEIMRLHVENGEQDIELHEVVSGSREVASMGCHILQRALSFKSRQGPLKIKSKLPTTWSSSLNQLHMTLNQEAETRKKSSPWMMNDLEKMVIHAKMLQNQVNSHNHKIIDFESLTTSFRVIEGLKPLEEKVKELYRYLISIRMVLLGILSKN
ncbi:unnamed protein product [Amaranthus hypochondriacus]